MDDDIGKIKVIPDYFQPSTSEDSSPPNKPPVKSPPRTENCLSYLWRKKRFRSAGFMLNLLNLKGLPWGSGADGQEKVELTAAELESLRAQLADLEEREAHLKAQLEHVDEILRFARLSGYLHIRTVLTTPSICRFDKSATYYVDLVAVKGFLNNPFYFLQRWKPLPGEPPPIDDTDVDDWLPRFVVLHGTCIFFYMVCTDLSPQDSALLSDIVEVDSLPCFIREEDTQYSFYILTRQGLRYECSSASKIQVDSWLTALQADCKSKPDTKPDTKLLNGDHS
ncbi:hypothetical protein EUGRSUZ_E00870 [Eucalyptus grandis]|uniref:Uncharacterized protein n=2 Tax=Eucalyptus grandis TaxID=71139 RepID=A0ACC3KSU4_EUCGR|nr:hypothetical protein EUGRSUZ_E00870 [Eucalyptus grandis]